MDALYYLSVTLLLVLALRGAGLTSWRASACTAPLAAAALFFVMRAIARSADRSHLKHDVAVEDVGAWRVLVLNTLPLLAMPVATAALWAHTTRQLPLSVFQRETWNVASRKCITTMWNADDLSARIALVLPLVVGAFHLLNLSGLLALLPWPLRIALPQLVYVAAIAGAVLAVRQQRSALAEPDDRPSADDRPARRASKPTSGALLAADRLAQLAAILLALLASVVALLLGPLSAHIALCGVLVLPLLLRIAVDHYGGVGSATIGATLLMCLCFI